MNSTELGVSLAAATRPTRYPRLVERASLNPAPHFSTATKPHRAAVPRRTVLGPGEPSIRHAPSLLAHFLLRSPRHAFTEEYNITGIARGYYEKDSSISYFPCRDDA